MSHNPNILLDLQKQLLESQKDGFNLSVKMLKDICKRAEKISITDNADVNHCIIKFFKEVIKNLETLRDEVYNVNKS